jgi:hypothetical protein
MKKVKWITGALLSLGLTLSLMVTALAANGYSYTATMSGGLHGTVSQKSDTFSYNEQWNPNDYTVTVTDGKYYFKGFHIAGQEGVVGTTRMTKDTDFVAAYGVRGDNTVAYTVNYYDADGNPIPGYPSQTFYGEAGEKPVVAFIYIEGYRPQAYNLTKTLSKNEAENVFTFEYTPVETTPGGEGGEGGGQGGGSEGEEA